MSMLRISSHMCGQATHDVSSFPRSTLFFSNLPMVWYDNFRTTKKVIVTKQLISLIKNEIYNGCNIQRAYNKPSCERKKINLLPLVKATLTPLPPFTYRGGSHKNIFRNSWRKTYG